ncbi:MAG: hypothetical protein LKE44_09910 [Eubacterium sp.]|jgi:phosphoglycolate phosphatase-like HAD superfamily hydrolase|nr:hypothetical protein [Eubacterium sp.]
MKNIFEETYSSIQKAKEAYKAAATEEAKETIRNQAEDAEDRIMEMGRAYRKIYREYEKSMDNENEYLDFSDVIWDDEVEPLIKTMKENGIEHFTYSCRATDAVETIWLFKQAGCMIEGMIEINARKNFLTGYDKAHTFLMSIR